MTPQLKSLNTGILKCAQSEFLKNIGNPNDIIEGCKIIVTVNEKLKDYMLEGFKQGFEKPFTAYVMIPTGDGRFTFYCAPDLTTTEGLEVWINTFQTSLADELVQIYWVGRNVDPVLALIQGSTSQSTPTQVFVMTPIVSQSTRPCFELYYQPYEEYSDEAFMLFAADCVLRANNVRAFAQSTLYFNGQLTMEAGSVEFSDYTELDQCGNLYLAPQEHPENIAVGAFVGNIGNLTYKGEWNETTRAWFKGLIFFLNGEPLDPIPSE